MNEFKKRGFMTVDEARCLRGYPSTERMSKGSVAVIECGEDIPCNPCENSCPRKAIKIGHPITNPPELDADLCNGCGLCIPHCPGQAIFVVDLSGEKALISMPYEFLPIPEKGTQLYACDRSGRVVTEATVVRTVMPGVFDKTAVLIVAVEKDFADTVRAVKWR